MAGLLTILFNLIGEVCLTMNLHSKTVCFFATKQNVFFKITCNLVDLVYSSCIEFVLDKPNWISILIRTLLVC
jgi:hypothetical protein